MKTKIYKRDDFTVIISYFHSKKILAGLRFNDYKNLNEQKKEAINIACQRQKQCELFNLPFTGGEIVVRGDKKKAINFLKDLTLKEFFMGPDLGCDKKILNSLSKFHETLNFDNFNEEWTAKSVIDSLKMVCHKLFDLPSVGRKIIAVQGLGKLGMEIAELLIKDGVNLIVTDLDKKKCERIKKFRKTANVKIVRPAEIYSVECDFFIPASISNVINKNTVKKLKCKAIISGAYNDCSVKTRQLHIPEVLTNAGGMLALAEEALYKKVNNDKLQEKIDDIPTLIKKFLEKV